MHAQMIKSADEAGKAADEMLKSKDEVSVPRVTTNTTALEVPSQVDTDRLLPQLWGRERFNALQQQLPGMLPHCSLSGESPLPAGPEGEIAVVVCYVKGNESTALVSTHLQQAQIP